MGTPADLTVLSVLAEPLRRRLYVLVASAGAPVSRDEAAGALGVSRAVAAFHLDKLAEAGLLHVDFQRPAGRGGPGAGRPAKRYRCATDEVGVSIPPRHYELAGRLLAEATTVAERDGVPVVSALGTAAHRVGESMGHEARQGLGTRPRRAEVLAAAEEALGSAGYEPHREGDRITLLNCPFHALAVDYRDLVCGMNLALLTGFTDGLEDGGLHAQREPGDGRCCVALSSGRGRSGRRGPARRSSTTPSGEACGPVSAAASRRSR